MFEQHVITVGKMTQHHFIAILKLTNVLTFVLLFMVSHLILVGEFLSAFGTKITSILIHFLLHLLFSLLLVIMRQ